MNSSDRARFEPADGPVFIDVEASALVDGYPIEVGWAGADVRSEAVSSNAVLISPAGTGWLEECRWDTKAEALHGISMAHLLANGLHPCLAAKVISLSLGDQTVCSDNPEADGQWIDMLYARIGAQRRFSVAQKSAASLIVACANACGMGDLDYTAAEQEARRRGGQRHRAGPDAAYWAHLWLLVATDFRAPPGAHPAFGPLRRRP